jgi:sugar lactone lactonase YvrE
LVTATYNVTVPVPATITTIAGSDTPGAPGTGGPALQAELGYLQSLAVDSSGDLYFADFGGGVVWKLTAATNTVSVAAGTPGIVGTYFGEGGQATKAILGNPSSVALDSAGDLFISDGSNARVYKVAAQTGIITTYAGGSRNYQYPAFGDGGPATQAVLGGPQGITLDSAGNLYIADAGVNRVRKVNATTGIITSVAGATGATALGDGGLATAAMLSPENMAFDASGNLYIVDGFNDRIREVNAKTGIITTVAGTGIDGFGGDGGPATSAPIGPYSIAISASGAIYFSNIDNTIREFVPGSNIATIAGTGYRGFTGDGGPARMAEFCGVAGLALDKTGNLYIADECNNRVRKVTFSKAAAAPAF